MSRHAMMALTLALLSGCGGGGGGGGLSGDLPSTSLVVTLPPVAAPAAPAAGDCTVAYWGDSIGALTTPLLNPGLQVTPHSIVGGTASAALPAFLQDPLAERFIVIEYGTNDANSGADLEAPVRSMLQWAGAKGRTPVLTGIPHESTGAVSVEANYNLWLSTLGTLYADWPGVPAGALMADGVHPGPAYQQALADALSQTILSQAPECTK